MPSVFDLLGASQPEPQVQADATPGQFGAGLRSGLYGTGAQLRAGAALLAENLGADEFARGEREAAQRLQAEANAQAPRISSYKQVGGLRDAYDYATGLLGQSVPVSGAVLAGAALGRTPIGRAVGGTLAGAPIEVGDVAQRQYEDAPGGTPTASAGTRLRDALLAGGASSVLQSVVPSIVAGKVAGQGTARGLRQVLLHAGGETALEGATEGGGEAVKQLGASQTTGKAFDTDAVIENAIGGAVAGGVMAGGGVAADAAHNAAKTTGNTLAGVVDATKGAASSGVQAVKDGTATALDKAVAGGQAAIDKATGAAGAVTDAVPKGEEVLTSAKQAKEDITDRLRQVYTDVAGSDTVDAFKTRVQGLVDAFKDRMPKKGDGTEKSEDFSGVRAQLRDVLVPALQDANPEIFNDPQALNGAADALRGVIASFEKGGKDSLSSTQIARLIDTFGDKTANVVDAAYRAVGNVNGPEAEKFYGALNQVVQEQRTRGSLMDVLSTSLRPELQDTVTTGQLRQEIPVLLDWARGAHERTGERGKFDDERMRFMLETRYGANADRVMKAVENAVKPAPNVLDAAEGGLSEVDSGAAKPVYYGRGASSTGLSLHPDADPAGAKGQAVQALARAQKENPDRSVSFVTAKDLGEEHPFVKAKIDDLVQAGMDPAAARDEVLGKYGLVAAEGTRQETQITRDDLPKITVKGDAEKAKTSHLQSASALRPKEGGQVFDAVKLTQLMEDRNKGDYTDSDNKSALHRTARMFMEGVAALQDHLGFTFRIPPGTVIDKRGTTWAEVKGLDFTPSNKAGEALDRQLQALRRAYAESQDGEERARIREEAQNLLDFHKTFDPAEMARTEGEFDMDPRGNIHALGDKVEPLLVDEAGNSLAKSDAPIKDRLAPEQFQALRDKFSAMEKNPVSAAAVNVARKGQMLLDNASILNRAAHKALEGLLTRDTKVSTAASVVNGLYEKYAKQMATPTETKPAQVDKAVLADNYEHITSPQQANDFLVAAAKRLVDLKKLSDARTDAQDDVYYKLRDMFREGPAQTDFGAFAPDPGGFDDKTMRDAVYRSVPEVTEIARPKAEGTQYSRVAANASSSDLKARATELRNAAHALEDELGSEVAKVQAGGKSTLIGPLQDAAKALHSAATQMADNAGSMAQYERGIARENITDDKRAFLNDYLKQTREMIAETEDKVVKAYKELGREPQASLQGVGAARMNAQDRKAVLDYLNGVLGNSVQVAFERIMHAGEFQRIGPQDIIRVSVFATDPVSVAHHEALHAFFAKLIDQGNTRVGAALERAAMAAPVQAQLRKLLAGEKAALAQLSTPSEAAAYMYQFWSQGKLTLGDTANGIFQRMWDAFKRVFGIWSTDERAEAILNYFHSGEFAKNMAQPDAVAKALIESGRNETLDKVRVFTKPLTELTDRVAAAGSERLRDTGIPALRQLVDAMKLTTGQAGEDAGFIPAARAARVRVLNRLAEDLRGYSKEHLNEALEAMQQGTKAASAEARLVQRVIQGPNGLLPSMLKYMQDAGVDIGKVQPRPDYFPRVWNAGFIASHQKEFLAMLEKYKLAGKFQGDPVELMHKLVAADGSEFTVEVEKPGMQFLKRRVLDFIEPADAAPFMRKDLYEVMSSYVTQATRRAEWARRFGDDGIGISRMLAAAKQQGATPEQIETAHNFVRSVDGTLGDTLDPNVRRWMGNIIVYQNLRLLPLAIFSSVTDPMGIMVRGGTLGDAWSAFKRGVREVRLNFKDEYQADADTQLALLVGTIDDASLMHAVGAGYSQGMVGDTARKINDTFFRFNLMEQFNRSMRVGATQAAISFLERHASGTASPHSERWMAELGFAPGEYKTDLNDPKVLAAINRWVDGAVLRPDAADKPIWMSDPRFVLISHLKQFVYSFHQTIVKRVTHEAMNGNYAPAMALTSYVPIMIAADLLKGVIQGGGEQPSWKKGWGVGDYVWSGVQRAGMLGVGEFAVGGVGSLAGPTIEQLAEGVQALGKQGDGAGFALKSLPGEALFKGAVH